MCISASLAAAPLFHIQKILVELKRSAVEMLHFDVEDGVFVPSHTLGTKVIRDLRAYSDLIFDVHLMVVEPERYIPDLAVMGVNRIAVHWEACPYPVRTLKMIREAGIKAGLAFNPATPVPDMEFCLPWLDFVNILTTEPTLTSSRMLPAVLRKIQANKARYSDSGLAWVADGGITPDNYSKVLDAGADIMVIGRGLFQGEKLVNINDLYRKGINQLQ